MVEQEAIDAERKMSFRLKAYRAWQKLSVAKQHKVEMAFAAGWDAYELWLNSNPAALLRSSASRDEVLEEAEKARETIRDALMESQYLAGARAGWNAAQADDPTEAMARVEKSRSGHMKGYKEAKAILAGKRNLKSGALHE